MAQIDGGYAAWLKSEELSLSVAPADAGRWAQQGKSITSSTPFAEEVGAQAEGARVATFLSGPLVRDRVIVAGERRDLWARTVRVRSDRLDYSEAGELVFVIGFAEQPNGTTVLTVLRKLS